MFGDDRDSDQSSISETEKRFVQIRCKEDFRAIVATEEGCLCALIVTSFMCPYSAKMLPLVKERFVASEEPQTPQVRYFHVSLVPEEKTDIDSLLQKDPVFIATKRPPTEMQKKQLHAQAYKNLLDLLNFLEVRSTPCMMFFLKGQILRVSDEMTDMPQLVATGSSMSKWSAVLQNAVIRRNFLMREYDMAQRREKRRIEREQRREARRRAKDEEMEEGEDDY